MKPGFEKRFNNGDIVYWCQKNGNKYVVKCGMVDEQFSDAVCIDLLEHKDTRYINGIPIDEFKSEQKYKKLPKGWSYDTKLFDLEYKTSQEDEEMLKEICLAIDNPESIKKAYEAGLLVKSEKIFHGVIDTDITKDGFRVILKYPMYENHITHVSVKPDKVYFSYEEAKKELDKYVAELERQSNLSEYEWSVEQIDKTLNLWKEFNRSTNDEVLAYRNWILSMDKVEDIETRICLGNIQWKYCKNKKWNYIVL